MRKYLKSAIVVEVLALTTAVAFLVAFSGFGYGRDRALLNISLALGGVTIVWLLLIILWHRTLQREVIVRRFYVSRDWIYNHEIGYAPFSRIVPEGDAYEFVTFAAEALARMSYGFEVANTPSSFVPELIIDSDVFLFHTTDDDEDEDGVVVDSWEGILRKVDDPDRGERGLSDFATFSNAGELARLLEELKVIRDEERGDVV